MRRRGGRDGEGTRQGDFDVGRFKHEEEEFAIIFGRPSRGHLGIKAVVEQ